jgi:hypothetical protein
MSALGRIFGGREHGRASGFATVDVLCLAFSRKRGGRCFAGLSMEDGTWVRPVSPAAEGTLYDADFRFADWTSPRLFDLVRVPFLRRAPEPHQPENVLMAPRSWTLLSRPAPPEAMALMKKAAYDKPLLFGSESDRRAQADFDSHPAEESLCLLRPMDLRFICRRNDFRDRLQVRTRFAYRGRLYWLSLTDPEWETPILARGPGEYRAREVGLDPQRLLLTVSLGKPFEGNCYKLVAAVFEDPGP